MKVDQSDLHYQVKSFFKNQRGLMSFNIEEAPFSY